MKEIDKKYAQDAGFISFEEALECMKNRGQAIPLKIQADCIHLSRGLLECLFYCTDMLFCELF